MQYTFDVIFQGKKQLTPRMHEVILHLEKGEFHFKPGQYIWLLVPLTDSKDPKGNRRAFFICSVPGKNQIDILVEKSESIYNNTLLNLAPGTKLQVAGPFGSSLTLDEPIDTEAVFISSGAGIAPFLSIFRSEIKKTLHAKIYFASVNGEDDPILYPDELTQLAAKQNVTIVNIQNTFSLEDNPLSTLNFSECSFFINGTQEMVNEVTKILYAKRSKKEKMAFGKNYPIAGSNLSAAEVDTFASNTKNLGFLAISQSSHHIIITDVNGTILFANDAAKNITGYSQKEMIGQTPRLWGGLMGQSFYKNFWARLLTGRPFIGQLVNRRKNGQPYHTIGNITPILNDEAAVIGFIDTEEDVTQRVFFEEHLRLKNISIAQEQQRVSALLESLGEGVIATDLQGMIVNTNPTAQTMLGFTSNELLGKRFTDIILAKDDNGNSIPPEKRTITLALSQRKRVQNVYTYVRKDESSFVAGVISTPIIVGEDLFGVITVFRDVTQEKEIDRAKTEFISLASHQLRTPLSAIKWFLGMLLAGDTGKLTSEQHEVIDNVYQSNERMIELVNSLLNVSRIESGRIIIDPIATNLQELLDSINKDLTAKRKERNQKISLHFENGLPLVRLDPLLIRQVYINLLTNALKYSPENTEVIVSISTQDNTLLSAVSDTGYGIPLKEKEKVFTKLYRGENILPKVPDGNGLGLYLVKQIIESSNGKIWFESEENKGTTFYFTLPLTGMQKKEGEVKLNS